LSFTRISTSIFTASLELLLLLLEWEWWESELSDPLWWLSELDFPEW
jgi:hypothetical protein